MEEDELKRESEKNQISILRSGNINAIKDTLNDLRVKGHASILPEIFELMIQTEDQEVQQACSTLLCDLKTQDAEKYLITALKDENYLSIKHTLVSACWQNSIDFHKEVDLFADILLKEDYAIALEAFTVIENSIGELDGTDILKLIEKLKGGLLASSDTTKNGLINELISVIKNY
jgi:hypothetical protein